MSDITETRSCNNEACGWKGPASECVHPKHDPSMVLCPNCRETTEADEINVFDWLELEIGGMSCEYHGDPVHTHDAYWMQQQVLRLLKDARKAFPSLTSEATPCTPSP